MNITFCQSFTFMNQIFEWRLFLYSKLKFETLMHPNIFFSKIYERKIKFLQFLSILCQSDQGFQWCFKINASRIKHPSCEDLNEEIKFKEAFIENWWHFFCWINSGVAADLAWTFLGILFQNLKWPLCWYNFFYKNKNKK